MRRPKTQKKQKNDRDRRIKTAGTVAGPTGPKTQVVEYEITLEPLKDDTYPSPMPVLGDEAPALFLKMQSRPAEAVDRLTELVGLHPDLPVLYNWLYSALQMLGRMTDADALLDRMHERFPDYYFARVALAGRHLAAGRLDDVERVMDNKFDLKLLYPHRTRFHISEVMGMCGLAGQYFAARGNLQSAEIYLQQMLEMQPDHPMTRPVADAILSARMKLGVRRLLGR